MDTAETTDGGPMTHIYLINLSPAILIDMLHGQGWTLLNLLGSRNIHQQKKTRHGDKDLIHSHFSM